MIYFRKRSKIDCESSTGGATLMQPLITKATTQVGDLIQLVSPTNKVYLVRLVAGGQLQLKTHNLF